MMQWEQLLSLKRQGDTTKRLRKEQNPTRLGFEVDYDRIIFSSEFRSLQDKTQVVPLSKTDFVHNRLTHSLEVSVVGRSIGRLVGAKIIEKYPYLNAIHGYEGNDFGAIVAAASLSHDIGNPPFGHSGEKAIGEYFTQGNGQKYRPLLSDKEWQDIIDFEGNANGFSVMAASREGVPGGLRLTYATLAAFMKYPKESLPKKPNKEIQNKKYGFFQQEKSFFETVATELGMLKNNYEGITYKRHPLAYLVEAADDICYTIIDFEDGINLGWIDEDFALEYLIKLVKNGIDSNKYHSLVTKKDRISYLRAIAIGSLINEAVRVFLENDELILKGEFPFALMDKCAYKAQMDDIIAISVKNVYKQKSVVEKELVGYKVIHTLLDVFCTAYMNRNEHDNSNYNKLIISLLPERFNQKPDTTYNELMNICQFVSLLTDGKALELFQLIQSAR
jgi:dGTPase